MRLYRNRITRPFSVLFLISFGLGGLTTGFLFPADSFAAVFNVTNSTQLRNALATAQSNGQDDTINLTGVTFSTGGMTFTYTAAENKSLTIVGAGAGTTILDGGGMTRVLRIDTSALSGDSNARITIRNLTIRNGNIAELKDDIVFVFGSGLFIKTNSAHINIENCSLNNNSAIAELMGSTAGGGAYIVTMLGNVALTNNSFTDNKADSLSEEGADGSGALISSNSGVIVLTGNSFTRNSTRSGESGTGGDGGATIRTTSGAITLTSNTFTSNSTNGEVGGGGAGIGSFSSGNITLTDNTFTDNKNISSFKAPGGGAHIFADSGAIVLTNNTFTGNSAGTSISGSAFGGGAQIMGTGSGNITLTNNTFINNSALSESDAFGGGADINAGSGVITLTNNTFTKNSATGSPDELPPSPSPSSNPSPSPELADEEVDAFIAGGGGLFVSLRSDSSTVNLYNNIIFDNEATVKEGDNETPGKGEDTFIDDDVDDNNTGSSVKLFNNDFSDFSSECENTMGCTPNIMRGNNIDADPLFVDDMLPGIDVHFKSGSPAINAGTASAPALPATDFEGDPRIVGSAPDIGADEFVPPPPPPIKCNGLAVTMGCRVNGAPNQLCQGTMGNDKIDGTTGNDVINSLGGRDEVRGFRGNDVICAGSGNDTVNGGAGRDMLFGMMERDILNGGDGNDRLFGGADNDMLNGNNGDDRLNGLDGTDNCDGGNQINGDTAMNCETVVNVP